MKRIIALGTLAAIVAPQVALAGHIRHNAGRQEFTCYRNEYRERYVPGTRNSPGYVRHEMRTVEFPCRNRLDTTNIQPYDPYAPDYTPTGRVDDNSCVEGAIIGGILGGLLLLLGPVGLTWPGLSLLVLLAVASLVVK